jgi:hypothetical protein
VETHPGIQLPQRLRLCTASQMQRVIAGYRILNTCNLVIKMEEVSQVWNKVLGRNQDWAASKPWENAERSGWLMKQGNLRNHIQAISYHRIIILLQP